MKALSAPAGFSRPGQVIDVEPVRIRGSGVLAYWQAHGFPSGCRATADQSFECDQ